MTRYFRARSFAVLALILILAAAIYGFAAANIVPETGAGDGSGTVSGYTITNVNWVINSDSDPSDVDSVSFDVNATAGAGAASEVYISLDGGTTWITTCTDAGATWTCTGLSDTVLSVTSLRVVAVE